MLCKTGFTHSDLLCWQIDHSGGSLNVNGTIMRDTYTYGWRTGDQNLRNVTCDVQRLYRA
ncbi:hypothetical protein FYL58_06295 [Klebsiella aerogenes]|nr:hypothetical protein [Klebsiella aerogenes]EIW9497189.1 hypothetical protein [Klebsiella aerogenes]